jgi:hypothetical protein
MIGVILLLRIVVVVVVVIVVVVIVIVVVDFTKCRIQVLAHKNKIYLIFIRVSNAVSCFDGRT